MYEEYFGLSGAPFKLNPDPKFFFGSRSHNKAMAYLHYGLKQAEGFIVITGPVGAGKSMLIGHLLDQLNVSNIVAAHLLTSNVEPDELLGHILSAFRIEPEGKGRTGQLEAFEDYLFDELNRGRRVLLIMDEAQNLPLKTLEEMRMLSNIDYDGTPLFQIFLVGQPEFRDTIESKELEQLRQRVIASYHLETLSEEETREYILHRLSVVGWREDPVFSDDAIKAIYQETEGLPRRINTLCNRLMLFCSLEKTHEVTGEIVEKIISELHEEKLGGKGARQVALPPVKSVDKEKPQPADNKKETAPSGDVVVSIDSARNKTAGQNSNPKTATPEEETKRRKSKMSKTKESAGKDSQPDAASMSVFDRLRAKRSDEKTPPADDAPQEATLTDVASAIAAASNNEPARQPQDSISESENGDDAALLKELSEASPGLSAAQGNGTEWRKSISRSINDTRDDLKQAHASVLRLRRKMSEIGQQRDDSRTKIAASLARAETLLDELRDAWR